MFTIMLLLLVSCTELQTGRNINEIKLLQYDMTLCTIQLYLF